MLTKYLIVLTVLTMNYDLVIADDFSNTDVTDANSDWTTEQNPQTQAQTTARILQDPHFQSLYHQHLAAGGTATLEQFAYHYAANGGFKPDGMNNVQNTETKSQTGDQDNRHADGSDINKHSTHQDGSGSDSTANISPELDSSINLPPTWEADSYNNLNGQTYYVDDNGQYFWIDHNNNDAKYPIYQNR